MRNPTKKEDPKSTAAAKPAPPDTRPTLRMAITLPVRLDETRRAVLGAELASLNTTHRTLKTQKAAASKDFANKIEKVEARSIPLEEALKAAKASAKVLVLPLEVDCEARPVPGEADVYDVYRMDTDPPSYLKRVIQPRIGGEQPGLPGLGEPRAPDEDEAKKLEDQFREQLKDVVFPEEGDDDVPSSRGRGGATAAPPGEGAGEGDDGEGEHFT